MSVAVKLDTAKMTPEQMFAFGKHQAMFEMANAFMETRKKTLNLLERQILQKVSGTLMHHASLIATHLAMEMKKAHPELDVSAQVVVPESPTAQ